MSAVAKPVTFALHGRLSVQTVVTAEIVRVAWPTWIEDIHWCEGAVDEESPAGRALLAASLLHGMPENDAPSYLSFFSDVNTFAAGRASWMVPIIVNTLGHHAP